MSVSRRRLVALPGASLAFTVVDPGLLVAHAQQRATVARVGFVAATSPGSTFEAFRQGFRQRGYVEGKNPIVEDGQSAGAQNSVVPAAASRH